MNIRSFTAGMLALCAACVFCLAPAESADWWSGDDRWDRDDYFDDVRGSWGNDYRDNGSGRQNDYDSNYSGSRNVTMREINQSTKVPQNTRPWSGAWYPRKSCELAFKNYSQGLSPFEKYDSIVLNMYGKVPGAAIWEADPAHFHNNAPFSNRPNWSGHCNGLAAAAILAPEPNKKINIPAERREVAELLYGNARTVPRGAFRDGRYDYKHKKTNATNIELTVADQKGWLAEIYMTCQTRQYYNNRPLELGHRWDQPERDTRYEAYRDIHPHHYHYLLQEFVKKQNHPIVAEVDPHLPINNHPVYGFDAKGRYDARKHAYVFRTRVYMTDYASGANSVGTKTLTRDYDYALYLDDSGRVYRGEWIGASVHKHPDFIWIPTANSGPYKTYENPVLNADFINFLFTRYGKRRAMK